MHMQYAGSEWMRKSTCIIIYDYGATVIFLICKKKDFNIKGGTI